MPVARFDRRIQRNGIWTRITLIAIIVIIRISPEGHGYLWLAVTDNDKRDTDDIPFIQAAAKIRFHTRTGPIQHDRLDI